MSLPYVKFHALDEYVSEIGQYCGDNGNDIDGGIVRLTCKDISGPNLYDEPVFEVESGFRAFDDFFVFNRTCDREVKDMIYEGIQKAAEGYKLKVLGGRFQL